MSPALRWRLTSRNVGAQKQLTRLLRQVYEQWTPNSTVSLGHALDEWLRTAELEETTRKSYSSYIERAIKPALGTIALPKVETRVLENFYTELRRCRARCSGSRSSRRIPSKADHDCGVAKCRAHRCRPLAASTVRQLHWIINGTMSATGALGLDHVRSCAWGAEAPTKPPEPQPPTPSEAARLSEKAFRMDVDWASLSASRSSTCALAANTDLLPTHRIQPVAEVVSAVARPGG